MKKDKEKVHTKPYKLAHQILSLTGINFSRQTVIGFTELTLIPTKDSFRFIFINSKQSCVYKITLNDTLEVQFQYYDPLLEICSQETKQRNLDYFNKHQVSSVISVDPEYGRGELVITVPSEAQHMIQEGKPLRVGIEFSIERPQAGLHFVIPNSEGSPMKGAHMFTYGFENSSRLWFPCIDTYNEVCTWHLEFTVDESMTAVSCGDLLEVVYTQDMRRKTFHYALNIPTAAPNIALAVGPFEIYVDPYMNEITHFCLPELLPVMKACSKYLHQAFEFYEELLSIRYPYSCYKQVYVDEAYEDLRTYTTMSIVSINLLCSTRIIDQVYETRKAIVSCVASQFFGCFISRDSWADAWLTGGISRYLVGLYVKKFFGFNEYKDWIHSELREVMDYEEKYGGIILDPSASPNEPQHLNSSSHHDSSKDAFYFSVKSPHACSPYYIKMYYKKAHLIIRMLEFKIGNELMMQVLNKHLSLGTIASQHKGPPSEWAHMVISTLTFTKTISTVTGKDITVFCDQWVRQGGHAKFKMKFLFNRKRNIVEMTIEQNCIGDLGIKRYVGPLTVWLQELDGTFKHPLQIEHMVAKKEIVCHSKSRRNKKKKIPLCTGEEVDMDLSHLDADSPVLWLRLDPDMTLMRSVDIEQPDNQWQYQLRHERDVTAQTDAITALDNLARLGAVTSEMRNTLNAILENETCYYKVRCRAAYCLTRVANAMIANWNGPPAMMQIFRKLFGSFSCPHIIRLHDFTSFQNYFLLKTLPVAMAGLRNIHKQVQPEVLTFLIDLCKYSDNSKNQFSDNYYRAALVDALAAAVTSSLVSQDPLLITPDSLSEDIKKILAEVTRYLNLEKMLPCYKHTVTCSCLRAIRILQKNCHLPYKPDIFKSYTAYNIYIDVRLAAVDQLIDSLSVDGTPEDLDFLLSLVENDPVPTMRYEVIRRLSLNPPFKMGQSHRLDTEYLVERLWKIMNSGQAWDSRIRCGMMDLYFSFYGRRRPASIPPTSTMMESPLAERKPSSLHGGPATGQMGSPLFVSSMASSDNRSNNDSFSTSASLGGVKTHIPTPSRPSTHTVLRDKVQSEETGALPGGLRIKQEAMSPEDSSMVIGGDPMDDPHHLDASQQHLMDRTANLTSMSDPFADPAPLIQHENSFSGSPDMPIPVSMIKQEVEELPDEHIPHMLSSPPTMGLEGSDEMGGHSTTLPLHHETSQFGSFLEPLQSEAPPTPTPHPEIFPHHKTKKRKKEKKHKKHKKHKHEHKEKEELDKLDKFAEEENLSSGSSNPPSPAGSVPPLSPRSDSNTPGIPDSTNLV